MRHAISRNLYLTFIMLLLIPLPALAIPAITCHCFTDRSFEASRPAAADPYFLATTQNSFFALMFNIDKKTVVIKKQQGTSPDDLWIAYWVASVSATSPDTLLQAKQKHEAWKDVLAPLRLTPKTLGSRFILALNAKLPSANLARSVVDELFISHQFLDDGELAALRQDGASNQELILAAVIAARTKRPARRIYLEVKSNSKTWGSLLAEANIDTKNMQREISAVLVMKPH